MTNLVTAHNIALVIIPIALFMHGIAIIMRVVVEVEPTLLALMPIHKQVPHTTAVLEGQVEEHMVFVEETAEVDAALKARALMVLHQAVDQ
jgi:hypothetical protein